ncbi:hypothetical protein I3842_15G103500 [Carya illinoinensis]|uniref:TIR domain-containing protein n=1 Tax=Carya illinoinensis TaxID=32201 RepID=A0A922D8A7_CARIL|nr:hypothetical protein I3842_15G103500 [Carya illinoinensis]
MALQGASSSLSSTSSSIRSWTHDVFLSFKGEDVRQKFISHLYHALHHREINTCIDKNLESGDDISISMIIVISQNYLESKWCLDELLKILECKEKVKQIVLPSFYSVAPSEVRHRKGIFGEAFAKLGHKIKDEVKVTKWKAALLKNESEFIQDIIKWVDSIMVNRTFLNVAKYLVGIESRPSLASQNLARLGSITALGGIGKTTIAKEIYNRISYQFEGSCFLSKILGISLDFHDIDKRINVIRHRLCSKRVLLILDDVDELVELETLPGALDWFGLGTRIIITTRDQHLLNISKCSTLKDQSIHQWKSVLNKYKQIPDINIQSVLRVSYDRLEDSEKDMFLDIACFFKGGTLADVIKIFDNCGFSPDYGIQRPIDKCLIPVDECNKYFSMLHLLQNMGREIATMYSLLYQGTNKI